jgi:hypothetical protein
MMSNNPNATFNPKSPQNITVINLYDKPANAKNPWGDYIYYVEFKAEDNNTYTTRVEPHMYANFTEGKTYQIEVLNDTWCGWNNYDYSIWTKIDKEVI